MPAEKEEPVVSLRFIFYTACCVALIVPIGYVFNFGTITSSSHSQWAEFGDYFGGVLNPVFAFFGLIALLMTIHIQSKELNLSRKELKLTREELNYQNETLVQQKFENSFFQVLRLHNDIVNAIEIRRKHGDKRGRDCFEDMLSTFRTYCKNNIKSSDQNPEAFMGEYERFYRMYQLQLGHYFRYLYNIFKFIDHAEGISDKEFYSNLVRAQLSDYELVIIFYNCFLWGVNDKFLSLAIGFSLFKHLPKELLVQQVHVDWLSTSDGCT